MQPATNQKTSTSKPRNEHHLMGILWAVEGPLVRENGGKPSTFKTTGNSKGGKTNTVKTIAITDVGWRSNLD